MQRWSVRQAGIRFSEMLDACITDGPQFVTRNGHDTAVMICVDEWRRLQTRALPNLKQLLLAEGARFEPVLPPRGKARRRTLAAAR